jgi:hypothetical protein
MDVGPESQPRATAAARGSSRRALILRDRSTPPPAPQTLRALFEPFECDDLEAGRPVRVRDTVDELLGTTVPEEARGVSEMSPRRREVGQQRPVQGRVTPGLVPVPA